MTSKSLLTFQVNLDAPALAQSDQRSQLETRICNPVAAIPQLGEVPFELNRMMLRDPFPHTRRARWYRRGELLPAAVSKNSPVLAADQALKRTKR